MKAIATLALCTAISAGAMAQTTITNGGFENWGANPSPGVSAEPNSWYSNQSGSTTAQLGPQTCFQDQTIFHTGASSVRVQNAIVPIINTVVNGNVTTGVVNAPTTNKADGYIGTVNYSSSTDIRHMAFTGRPDSLVGWYQYVSGGTGEQCKIRAILHTGDYFDPETPTTYHADPSANKIADVTFTGATGNVSTWTRFSVPFTYVSSANPTYIMISVTSSANQTTTFGGSKMWLDDLEAVYTPTVSCSAPTALAATGVTSTSASISWTIPSGSLGSEYVLSTSATTPTGSGAGTTAHSYSATSLTPATTYHAFVRDSCSATDLSAWSSIIFTTLHPAGVTGVGANTFAVTAYPNPVSNELSVKIDGTTATNGKVTLMDMTGKTIKTVTAVNGAAKMDMSVLSAGTYMIRYTDAAHTKTVMVEKQ